MDTILFIGCLSDETRVVTAGLAGEYRVRACCSGPELLDTLRRSPPAAVLAEWGSQLAEGPRPPSWLESIPRRIPVLALVDPGSVVQAAQALRLGVAAAIPRDSGIPEFRRILSALVRSRHPTELPASPFVGSSAPLRAAADRLRLYAPSDHAVLIVGESGTGKDLAARALHAHSQRNSGPFVALNCAALPELLAESELFGTERGAFTDAVSRPGAFELANGGTLFLDEIGEMGRPVQAKLLRAIESREFWPLGARKPRISDLRIVSATARELDEAVASGAFRRDLLYRIDTLTIRLPSLRDCRQDIPEIARHLVSLASAGRARLSSQAAAALMSHDWPGNVRQLRSVILRALVHADGGRELRPEHIVF